ncbi:YceI family protein [Jannaschia rubra]|uniref:YceI family protein n=1 Tax=Jannaschia rubra TaxID=282197 RepID=UPI002490570E|nr:YceI family protein [Jannaschia rubra]
MRLPFAVLLALFPLPVAADWTLSGDASTLAFVSIKNGRTAETHGFTDLTGTVSDAGEVEISIPLASVETSSRVYGERMKAFLFRVAHFPEATVTGTVDMDALALMADGTRRTALIDLTLTANGRTAEYPAEVSVTRIGEDAVTVGTTRPVIVDARDLGYEDGIEKLRALANLDAIASAVPVTFDLMFKR